MVAWRRWLFALITGRLIAALRRPHRPLMLLGLAAVAALVGYGFGTALHSASNAASIPSPPVPMWIGPLEPASLRTAGASSAEPAPNNGILPQHAPRQYEEALPIESYEPGEAAPADLPSATPPATMALLHPGSEAQPAWRRFAAASPERNGRPMVSVVIDDLGMDRRRTARTITLHGPLTLSFLPYAGDLPDQTARARAGGHELLVHVGMEPTSAFVDPGPNALLTGLAAAELRRRLVWGLARFDGYVGINNHMGSRFTADRDGMTVVMEELGSRGLLYLDSRTTPETVGPDAARRAGVPFAERSVFLDPLGGVATVQDQLREAEAVARRRGTAVAIGHPHDETLDALQAWLPGLDARGIALAPLSAVVAAPSAPTPPPLHISKR
ncbi:MAG: divergent polysaccharide deacetylase family protein [Rhodospirillales bacterium]|nr:divergent polysaccharide deacetylase family protein [Rhodospirillales bacterium]